MLSMTSHQDETYKQLKARIVKMSYLETAQNGCEKGSSNQLAMTVWSGGSSDGKKKCEYCNKAVLTLLPRAGPRAEASRADRRSPASTPSLVAARSPASATIACGKEDH